MKELIDKVTNKDRLIKLYGCSERGDTKIDHKHWCTECGNMFYSKSYLPLCCTQCKSLNVIIDPKDQECPKCNGKGYTINRDSQVLNIVEELIKYRAFSNGEYEVFQDAINERLASALIKLIELGSLRDHSFEIVEAKTSAINGKLNSSILSMINGLTLMQNNERWFMLLDSSYTLFLDFCNHHKIDIWKHVTEILEEIK